MSFDFRDIQQDNLPPYSYPRQLICLPPIRSMAVNKRSRLGCLTCRRKKKKCNQQRPVCERCHKGGNFCEWPVPGQEYKNKRRRHNQKFINYTQPEEAPTQDLVLSGVTETSSTVDMQGSRGSDTSEHRRDSIDVLDNSYFSWIWKDLELIEPSLSPQPVLYEVPKLPLVLSLNTLELEYFEYYYKHVAHEISIVPKEHNYFLKSFLPMAHQSEAILRSLVAWGCVLRAKNERTSSDPGLKLIQVAKECISKSDDFIAQLTSYVILMCIKITTGSTFDWSGYLTNCYDLINGMGGFKILKGYSEEGKILAQNFAYFDILASQSNENGTYYPVSEYNAIFNLNTTTVDPLLGCTRPLILILGDVINLVVEYSLLDASSSEYYNNLESIIRRTSKLEQRLLDAEVCGSDLALLKEGEDVRFHTKMFELYNISIRMYVKQALRRLPSVVPEMQTLHRKSSQLIDQLLDSPLKSGLCFPLLITGVNAVSDEDRLLTHKRLVHLSNNHGFESLEKIRFIIQEVWQVNMNGMLCVDYFKVTKHFGWKLNIGR